MSVLRRRILQASVIPPYRLGSTAKVWFNPADLALADGTPIDSWVDRLSGVTLAKISDATRPVYRAGVVAGMPAVQFTRASGHVLKAAAPFSTATTFTMICVVQFAAMVSGWQVIFTNGASEQTVYQDGYALLVDASNQREVYSTPGQPSSVDGTGTTEWEIWVATYDGAVRRLWINGAEQAITNPTSTMRTPRTSCYVGNDGYGSAFGGYLGDVIHCDGAIPFSLRRGIERYFAQKYRIALGG